MKKSIGAIGGLVATLVAAPVVSAQVSDTVASDPGQEARSYSQYRFNTISGASGLLRTVSADSGAPGTFRLSYLLSFYSGSGFLCPSPAACGASGTSKSEDSVARHGEDIALSATLTPYLEMNLALHSHSVSDDFYNPSVMQVLADTQMGFKAFTPRTPDRIFAAGALGQLKLLGGSGSIGPSTANVVLGAIGTLDLANRVDAKARIPLRFNANLGYLFDNTSTIAEKTERDRGHAVTRFERFGLGINRVDSMLIGFGGEFVHPVVQPFAEWTMDITSNRQNYTCVLRKAAPGDDCLSRAKGIDGAPSRFTLGAHFTPPVPGLSAVLAFDIGTSGTSHFVAERAPEIPWNFYVGLGYAIDTYTAPAKVLPSPKPAEVVQVTAKPEYRIVGHVTDETTSKALSGAKITYEGQARTGMITKADGSFESGSVEPGEYTLSVAAEDYKDGTCKVTVAPSADSKAAAPNTPNVSKTEVQCSLKSAPAVATMFGAVVNAESGAPVANCRVTLLDERKRAVEVRSDSAGTFVVQNVPAGTVHIRVSAEGYLPTASQAELKKRSELHSTLPLHKAPKSPNVTVTPKELKLKTPLALAAGAPPKANDVLLQEVAAVLLAHPELSSLELQSYTDDSGDASADKRLSEEQASQVRARLVELGVEEQRLGIAAHGNETPLAPNTNPANRIKNRRIRFAIVQRHEAP